MILQDIVTQINSTEEQTTINLNTISDIFRKVTEGGNVIDRDVVMSATHIVGSLMDWGEDDTSRPQLQNQSAQ